MMLKKQLELQEQHRYKMQRMLKKEELKQILRKNDLPMNNFLKKKHLPRLLKPKSKLKRTPN